MAADSRVCKLNTHYGNMCSGTRVLRSPRPRIKHQARVEHVVCLMRRAEGAAAELGAEAHRRDGPTGDELEALNISLSLSVYI